MISRVVITGMGAVSAAGIGADVLWAAARDGVSHIADLDAERFANSRIRKAAAIRNFDPASFLTVEEIRTLDRFSMLALKAAEEALHQSALDGKELGDRTAVIIGSGIGGATTSDAGFHAHYVSGERADPMSVPKTMPSAAASRIGMRYGARGPTFCISSACASAAQAIGVGMQMVRSGMVERAIVGGSEAMLTPAVMRAWEVLRVLTPGVPRPFSKGRDGMAIGEGAGVLVLEPLEAARARGARVLAEIAGYGTTSDAADLLKPDLRGAARAMSLALDDAGLAPDEIGYVNAHGTATVSNDSTEAAALAEVFGSMPLPVSSTKPVHGHTIGAAGAIELIIAIKALLEQIAPPTINWLEADAQCPIDPVPNVARAIKARAAMSNSFAFGGINASLVIRLAD